MPLSETTQADDGDVEIIEIYIRTLDSSQLPLRVRRDVQVLALKQQAEALLSIPSERQRLIFSGRVLKDERTLSDYGVQDGCVLHCVPRPEGAASSTVNDEPPPPSTTTTTTRGHGVFLGTLSLPEANVSRLMDTVLRGLGMQVVLPAAQSEGVATGGSDDGGSSSTTFAAINSLIRQAQQATASPAAMPAANNAGDPGTPNQAGDSPAGGGLGQAVAGNSVVAGQTGSQPVAWAFLRHCESLLESLALG